MSTAAQLKRFVTDAKELLESQDGKQLRLDQKASSQQRRYAAQRFLMRLRPLESRFEGRLKRFFFELRGAILAQFLQEALPNAASVKVPALVERVILLFNPAKQRLRTVSEPFIQQAIEVGGDKLADFGITFNLGDPAVRDLLTQRSGKIRNVVGTVERNLRRQLADGYEQQETVTQLADRIRDVFNFTSARSNTIARTEMSNAANAASVLGERQAGVERHQWATAGDELVRDTHAAQDGEIVALDEPFTNGLLYPGDTAGSAEEVVNCRCTTIPIFNE